MDMGVSDDYLRNAAAAATNNSVADQIREGTLDHIWRQLREDVAPGVLFQVDEAHGFPGTQDDRYARSRAPHMTQFETRSLMHTIAALLQAVTGAVLADARVREAVNEVSRVASEVAASEMQRLRAN